MKYKLVVGNEWIKILRINIDVFLKYIFEKIKYVIIKYID